MSLLRKILLKEEKEIISVFRVENKIGLGPFRDEIKNLIKKNNLDDYNKYKIIYKDISKLSPPIIYNLPKNYVFGFKNLNDLKKYFSVEVLKFLSKYGFKIKKYKTKFYYSFKNEIAFKK